VILPKKRESPKLLCTDGEKKPDSKVNLFPMKAVLQKVGPQKINLMQYWKPLP
jgi:hypothetical protein